jgi:MoxR-like ATPase
MRSDTDAIEASLSKQQYIADQPTVNSLHLARMLKRPLLVEGPAGVGKTEIAKAMARSLDTQLIRLQCYEGLDAAAAIYEWNYQKQLLHIRLTEESSQALKERETEIFSREFLLERPLLKAVLAEQTTVLLIDEIDRTDEAFEAFLLELLSEWQITIPEMGTLLTKYPPITVLTSNRTRELSDALRRRCLYLWLDYPSFDKELEILRTRVPAAGETLTRQITAFLQLLRRLPLEKTPGISESLDWAAALVILDAASLGEEVVLDSTGVILKHVEDQVRFKSKWLKILLTAVSDLEVGREQFWLDRAWQQILGKI